MTQPRPRKVPPMVSLRTVRESQGLNSAMLAGRIKERGVDVHADSLINVELGRKGASNELIVAWANVLGLNPADIYQDKEIRGLVAETDELNAGQNALGAAQNGGSPRSAA